MATGISKNKWEDHEWVITSDEFASSDDVSYSLEYNGKLSEEEILSYESDVEFDSIVSHATGNRLFYGDNYDVLSQLLRKHDYAGKVKLIYIDPPYGTNTIFQSRNQKNSYRDDLVGAHFIEFLRKRLVLLRELLSKDGSIYVHLDSNMAFQTKVIMDEVFGVKNFRGFITRKKCSNKNSTRKTYGNISDYILFYSKSDNYVWNRAVTLWTEEKIKKEYPCFEKDGRRYKKVPIHAPGLRNGETGKEWRGMMPPPGKHWQYTPQKLDELDKRGEIYWSANGNPRRKVYLDENKGIPVQDIWLDVQDSLNQSIKVTGYPTEKNPSLLERIIRASSDEGDLVLDCFAGSGTTLGAASDLNRSWIGIDNSLEAIRHIFKRFKHGLDDFGDYVEKNTDKSQTTLFSEEQNTQTPNHKSLDFNFLCDNRFSNQAVDELTDFLSNISKLKHKSESVELGAVKSHFESDDVLTKLIEKFGEHKIYPKKPEEGFRYLCEAIISQQLSVKAADSIIKKFTNFFSNRVEPRLLLKTGIDELKNMGISSRKASFIHDLSEKVSAKELVIEELEKLDNELVLQKLTEVKGIGTWTAKMYLIFVLGRKNVFPEEDTAFLNSVKKLYSLSGNGKLSSELMKLDKKWFPYQSVAAWYIWRYNDAS